MNKFFSVKHFSKTSKARLGEITTDHGAIKTPAFVPCGTKGTIKALTPQLIKDIRTQVAFVNTYHLITHPGADIIEKAGGIHKYSRLNIPLMSDSGGFQVFSLANKNRKADVRGEEQPILVKISEDGVKFRSIYDGQLIEFTPEKSMEFQRQIGADINMAFDECTYYPATHEYAEKAMERTHDWLKRCIKYVGAQFIAPKGVINHAPTKNQYLYGVIQGGTFEDLRKKSAEFVVSQSTPGVAIGGVSVGETKAEMREQVKWVSEYLPKDRPVHLLGVGQIDDIIDLVKYGVDTFDCVEPTRLARMGMIYQLGKVRRQNFLSENNKPKKILSSPFNYDLDITKSIYKNKA
ncbi:MAG: tRNA guanosine(34) transglycosylase Tgt [Patescibacteria group bacterium]